MKSDLQLRLGRRISGFRWQRSLTQEQLAERCGFTVKFISSIERGKVNVPFTTLAAVAKALGATISELTLGTDVAMPKEVREVGQLYAGRARGEQAAMGRVLAAIRDLVDEAKRADD